MKSEIPEMEDSLTEKMKKLFEIKTEIKEKNAEYEASVKDLKESRKSLETLIIEEVKKIGHSVTVGNIKAEYIPQVVIKMKKVKNNGD